jgi:hypothetical protein
MSDERPPPSDDDRPAPEPDTAEHPIFRQELLPQQIRPAPRRTGLIVAVVAIVLLVGAVGVVVWLLGEDDGGGDRDAYCETLRTATNDGDVAGALGSTDPAVLDRLADEAPDAVADDWERLVDLRDMFTDGAEPSTSDALAAVTALQAIVDDAHSECGITLDLPLP